MQRLNHHHLYIFWVYSKTSSFTKAAEELRIAQSAVTSQIKSLEEVLGISLIDRTNPRKPEITSEGRKVLEYADSIFESSRELLNWATKGGLPKKQILRIGALSGMSRNLQFEFIEPLLGRADLKLEVTTGDQKKLIELLQSHELDVVLTSNNVTDDYRRSTYANVLTSSPVVFVANQELKIKKNEDLAHHLSRFDLFIPGQNFEAKPELDAFLDNLKVKVRIAGEVDDIALLRILALRSKSIIAIPEVGVINDLRAGELSVVGTARGITQRFYAMTRQKLNPSNEIKSLVELMRRRKA